MPKLPSRADLAERLSALANAPPQLVGQLAREDEIAIAGPLLRRSPRDRRAGADRDRAREGPGPSAGDVRAADACRPISPTSSSAAAIATWSGAPPAMPARRSRQAAIPALIKRAGAGRLLTLTVGQRDDLSGEQLKQLLDGIARRHPPPPARAGQSRAASRDQARDERQISAARCRPRPPAISRRHSARSWPCISEGISAKRAARLRQGAQIRGIDRHALGDVGGAASRCSIA